MERLPSEERLKGADCFWTGGKKRSGGTWHQPPNVYENIPEKTEAFYWYNFWLKIQETNKQKSVWGYQDRLFQDSIRQSPQHLGGNLVLTLLWGGFWTKQFPKVPSILNNSMIHNIENNWEEHEDNLKLLKTDFFKIWSLKCFSIRGWRLSTFC